MTYIDDETVYFAAIHTAAYQVNQIAYRGKVDEEVLDCLINSLLVVNPANALEAYGGSDRLLRDGYQLMVDLLYKTEAAKTPAVNYVLMMLLLERKVFNNPEMMQAIGDRLSVMQSKVEHFGSLSDQVISGFSQLYEETVSHLGRRIMVLGEPQYLQQSGIPEKIRTLLLAGIRATMQWQYVGGRRWRLAFQRKKVYSPAIARLEAIKHSI